MNGTGESFLSLDLFSVGFKNIFLVLLRGRSPPSPPPWTHHWLQRHMTGCFSAFYVNTCACHVYFTVNLLTFLLTKSKESCIVL